MLLVNYEAPDGSKRHNRLWNGGNGWGTVKLYDKKDGGPELVDEVEATHIGCEYGEYDQQDALFPVGKIESPSPGINKKLFLKKT